MGPSDLFSVALVQAWLNTSRSGSWNASNDDPVISRLVTAASAFARQYLQRDIAPTAGTDVYNGQGQAALILRRTPIVSIQSLSVDGTSLPARAQVGSYGYVADRYALYLSGGAFSRGIQNVVVSYTSGYQTSEPQIVPATPYQLGFSLLAQSWNADVGVSYVGGSALVRVASGTPAAGQYLVDVVNERYQFAAADAAAGVVVSYGYTPADVVAALVEMVGERFKARQRIGETSQNLGNGQVVAFSAKDMSDACRTMLQPYRNVAPVAA